MGTPHELYTNSSSTHTSYIVLLKKYGFQNYVDLQNA